MKFAQPIWLILGLAAIAVLIWRHRRADQRQRTALNTFAASHLVEQLTRSFSPGRRRLKRALLLAGTACVFLALARPQWGYRWEEAKRNGLDILFAVDTSKSMLAQDIKPDRLTRAKLAVSDLVDKLNGDGVGLIAFAGSSFLQSPVTLDYDAFRETLNALDTTVIPRPGTDIAAAIHEAQAAFRTQANRDKILILITDGEDLAGNALTAAEAAGKDGVKIFTVGVGSTTGGLIPLAEGGFAKDNAGQFVKSKLEDSMLKKIAAATGGQYQPLGQHGEGLASIYDKGLAPFTRHDLAARQNRVALEHFQWPLLAAVIFFIAELLIGNRKRSARFVPEPPVANKKLVLRHAAATALALIILAGTAHGSPQSAEKAYLKGDFKNAAQQYQEAASKKPARTELLFNTGAAAYKTGAYDKAAEAFQHSLKTDQVKLQQDTYYNLGNTQYRLGQQTEKADKPKTIQTWEQAVQSYEAALQIKADDADAKFNRDLVKKKLEELKKQQEQENKDQKDKQDKQDQKNQDKKDQQNKGNDQKNQDQKQDKGQQGQDQAKQDQKDQKSKPDSGKDQQAKKDQQANAGQQPQPSQPKDEKGNAPKPDKDGQEQAEAQRVPGQMTKEEAKNLLDAMKNDDRRMPVTPLTRGEYKDQEEQSQKDW